MEFKHDLFLCHNKADKDWVRDLGEKIESEEYDGRNLKVFFDEWDIRPGENIISKLEEGITESRFVGIVLSEPMLKAEWPKMEWSIAVYMDPSGRKGLVIPIWKGECEIPPSLMIRNFLNFSNNVESTKSFKKLLAMLKNETLPRGQLRKKTDLDGVKISEQFPIDYADEINEQIASNLLPITTIPRHVWIGPCGSVTYKEVFDHLNKTRGINPTFVLRENRLYSFWDLNDPECPFRTFLIGDSIEKIEITPWLNNLDKKNILIELLNRAFRNHCFNLELQYDKRHNRHFFFPYAEGDRTFQWHTGERKSTRTVVKKYVKGKSKYEFWKHHSLHGRFLNLGSEIFLQLVPGYTFTRDGYTASGKDQGSLSTKWTHEEYNSSVFYHIRFWCYVLSSGENKIKIYLGKENYLDVDITPSVAEISVGIDGDHLTMDKVFDFAEEDDTDEFSLDNVEGEVYEQ